jgi:hypothetical protein
MLICYYVFLFLCLYKSPMQGLCPLCSFVYNPPRRAVGTLFYSVRRYRHKGNILRHKNIRTYSLRVVYFSSSARRNRGGVALRRRGSKSHACLMSLLFFCLRKIPGGVKNRAEHGLRGFMPRNIVTPYECRRHEVRGGGHPPDIGV